jgi:hypothetical protein
MHVFYEPEAALILFKARRQALRQTVIIQVWGPIDGRQ